MSFSFTLPLSTLFDGYMYVSCRLFVLDCFSCYFFGGGVGVVTGIRTSVGGGGVYNTL